MCLIIKKPAGRHIPESFLRSAWSRNPHGWGVAHAADERLVVDRGMDFDELVRTLGTLPAQLEVHVHLRYATSGRVNLDMTHPFVVRPGLVLMHNGVIPELEPKGEHLDKSDTWNLARLLRQRFDAMSDDEVSRSIRQVEFRTWLERLAGGSMVVLHDVREALCFGRRWYEMTEDDWDDEMAGMEVSNHYGWRPRGARRALRSA